MPFFSFKTSLDSNQNLEDRPFTGISQPLYSEFYKYADEYEEPEFEDGKYYISKDEKIGGKDKRLITFGSPFRYLLKRKLMFPTFDRFVFFHCKDGELCEYFTGQRLDVLSYDYLHTIDPNSTNEASIIDVFKGETPETLREKGVTGPFIHDIDLLPITEEDAHDCIKAWEEKGNRSSLFTEEFNQFSDTTKRSFLEDGHGAYTLEKPH